MSLNLLQIAQVLLAVFQILHKFAPQEQAAVAAFKAGGIKGLITYLESLNVSGQAGPAQAEIASAVSQLKAVDA